MGGEAEMSTMRRATTGWLIRDNGGWDTCVGKSERVGEDVCVRKIKSECICVCVCVGWSERDGECVLCVCE